jgi:asparagine synthase (glutamine-hydrolysing)
VLLSGGLDSSLVAALAAEERLPGQRVTCLTSAAWPGSGIKDETEWAAMVADHLGLPLVRVAPGPETPVYQLRATRLNGATGPMLAPLHFVYDALEEAALAAGAALLLDGGFGELTVSGYRPPLGSTFLQDLRRQIRARSAQGTNPTDDFLVRASAAVRSLRSAKRQEWQALRTHPGAHGFALGFDKAALRTTDGNDPRLRRAYPFRDRALGQLMAAFPAEYVAHGGMDRAPIRALLAGRVPERVAMRETKQPFAPTYFALLAAQAPNARTLIPAQRLAGADEWLDLDWLDQQLEAAIGGATLSRETWSQVHCTVLLAEFIRWWGTERTGS